VAVAGTKSTKEAENKRSDEARLIVLGDSELVNNQFLSFGGNKDLFLNCINWLGKEENAISIRPKNRKSSRIFLTSVQKNFLNYSTQWIYPLLLIAFGATIYIRRRRK